MVNEMKTLNAIQGGSFCKKVRQKRSHKFFVSIYPSYQGKCKKSWKKLSFRGAEAPPLVYVLTASTECGLFESDLNFRPFPVLLGSQTPFQMIRHEKIHHIRHQEHQNRTFLRHFRRWNLNLVSRDLSKIRILTSKLIFSHFQCSQVVKHHSK